MKTTELKAEFVRVVARFVAQTSLTEVELQTFVEQLLDACNIAPNDLTVAGFTKIVSTAIGFLNIARSVESGAYIFKPEELKLINGIVNETEAERNLQ